MELYFLRHAIAAEMGTLQVTDDSQRPLIPEGVKKMKKGAEGMVRMGLSFDVILSSPYVRARQTAEIAAEALGHKPKIKFTNALTPEASFKELEKLLKENRRQYWVETSSVMFDNVDNLNWKGDAYAKRPEGASMTSTPSRRTIIFRDNKPWQIA